MEITNTKLWRQIVYIRLRWLFVINLDPGQHEKHALLSVPHICVFYGLYINYFQQIPFPTHNESHVITKHSNRCHSVYTVCSRYVCVVRSTQSNIPNIFSQNLFCHAGTGKKYRTCTHTSREHPLVRNIRRAATKKTKESNETINTQTQHIDTAILQIRSK